MYNRKTIYTLMAIFFVLFLILSVIIISERNQEMSITFLDVGQGDSILISQGSQQVLIDGGKDGKRLMEKLGKSIPFWDRKIELIIETHPDADHIGGLIDVFSLYEVDNVMKTKMRSQSQIFKTLEELIENEKSAVIEASSGKKIKFNNGAEADIVFPFGPVVNVDDRDTNAASVVIKLNFGVNNFLFTGDLPTEQEKEILKRNVNLKSNVLKVGHHGSKYSSSSEFLNAIQASDAIISVGKGNVYGHPNPEAMQRLLNNKINIYRTDELGDIKYKCENANSICRRYF